METDPEQEEIKKLKKKLKEQQHKNSEIRDQMSMMRTSFSNERTLMAYIRTAIALLGGGFAAVKLSEEIYLEILGVGLMIAGILITIYSFYRYFMKKRLLRIQRKHYEETGQLHKIVKEKEASGYGNTD